MTCSGHGREAGPIASNRSRIFWTNTELSNINNKLSVINSEIVKRVPLGCLTGISQVVVVVIVDQVEVQVGLMVAVIALGVVEVPAGTTRNNRK